jgi:hypothetical protein
MASSDFFVKKSTGRKNDSGMNPVERNGGFECTRLIIIYIDVTCFGTMDVKKILAWLSNWSKYFLLFMLRAYTIHYNLDEPD